MMISGGQPVAWPFGGYVTQGGLGTDFLGSSIFGGLDALGSQVLPGANSSFSGLFNNDWFGMLMASLFSGFGLGFSFGSPYPTAYSSRNSSRNASWSSLWGPSSYAGQDMSLSGRPSHDGFTSTRTAFETANRPVPALTSGQTQFTARSTSYYPHHSKLEGGYVDRIGKPLRTLQDYLEGKADYVSVAMDTKAFKYGTKLRIPELEEKYGRPIEFRVVDTGGAFKNRGTSRIDIATRNWKTSVDPSVNKQLTVQVVS